MKLRQFIFHTLILTFLPIHSTYATETINIYVANDTKFAIFIQQDNIKRTIAAGTRELNIPLLNYIPVTVYRENQPICTWYVHAKPTLSKELIGLTFNGHDCISDYVTNP